MSRHRLLLALSPFLIATLASCSNKHEPTVDTFMPGMNEYLEKRGDLCLGKTEWPVDVTDDEALQQSRSGVQMPVLERFGIVHSEPTTISRDGGDGQIVKKPGRRYALTAEGKRNEHTRETNARDGSGRRLKERDLCPVKLDLDRVVRFEIEKGEHPSAMVSYTYRVTAADWTREPEVARVFPAMARVIQGEHVSLLQEDFVSTDRGWVAVDVYEEPKLLASGTTH